MQNFKQIAHLNDRIMPPRRVNQNTETNPELDRIIGQHIRDAIPNIVSQVTAGINSAQGASNRSNGVNPPEGETSDPKNKERSYKEFMHCKPKEFCGTEGATGLIAWIESIESVLSISRCAEDCKVEFAAARLQGRALTWWNLHGKF